MGNHRPSYSLRNPKCMTCFVRPQNFGLWAWQPFGPGDILTFTALGTHYRGWPVITICDECKQRIEAGLDVFFDYQKIRYGGNKDKGFAPQVYGVLVAA